MTVVKRRGVRIGAALAVAAGLVLAGCAQDAPDAPADPDGEVDTDSEANGSEDVELRMYWWGSDVRHQVTQEAIDAFEEQNPGITIQAEFAEWAGYWDRLATMTAGGDMPDIIQMDLQYLAEYGGRGTLADLEQLPIDFSDWDDSTVDSGRTPDGLFAAVAGINAPVALLNPDLFDEAGVELPDDRTWTWEDYADIAGQITDSGVGLGSSGFLGDHEFEGWLNQQGLSLFSDEGGLGFEPSDLAEFYAYVADLSDAGAMPDPAVIADDVVAPVDQTLFATGDSAMSFWWSNQLSALEAATGTGIEMTMRPSSNGGDLPSGTYYKASQFFSIAETSPHQEEAAQFLDFLLNSEEAGQIVLVDRGIAPNTVVREAIVGELDDVSVRVSEFIDGIADVVDDAPPIPPEGGSVAQDVLRRHGLDVVFGQVSPEEGAEAAHSELLSGLG